MAALKVATHWGECEFVRLHPYEGFVCSVYVLISFSDFTHKAAFW
jgi:hypothetical protein